MPTNIIAVYGTLRAGLNNHTLISKCKRIGHGWLTGFRMYNLGEYPGAIRTHDESGRMRVEWYDVSDELLAELDKLEGYYSNSTHSSLYLRKYVGSPYGRGWIYTYNRDVDESTYMEAGDWVRYLRESMSQEDFMALAMSDTSVGKDAQNRISLDTNEPVFNEDSMGDKSVTANKSHPEALVTEENTPETTEKNKYTFEVIKPLNSPESIAQKKTQHSSEHLESVQA